MIMQKKPCQINYIKGEGHFMKDSESNQQGKL